MLWQLLHRSLSAQIVPRSCVWADPGNEAIPALNELEVFWANCFPKTFPGTNFWVQGYAMSLLLSFPSCSMTIKLPKLFSVCHCYSIVLILLLGNHSSLHGKHTATAAHNETPLHIPFSWNMHTCMIFMTSLNPSCIPSHSQTLCGL